MDILLCRGLVLNRPDIFADPAFRDWLANGERKFTWHAGGDVDEWSDVILLVDPSLTGEGSDSDMPAAIWENIIALCRQHLGVAGPAEAHYMVRLTNLVE